MAIFLLIFFLLLTAYCLLVDYYRRAWNSIPDAGSALSRPVKVSVIVPVRNEEKNIAVLVQRLYEQDYPKNLYDVIIVDDHSTDQTWNILNNIYYPGFTKIAAQLADHLSFKKNAITAGIALSQSELIITTDADCSMGTSWLSSIVSFYQAKGAKFIAAPVIIEPSRSLLGVFQTLDFLTLQGITGASVHRKFHSMCNGANLAYMKDVFMEVNGFEGIDNIPSGDDMLLMHKVAMRYPGEVFYLKSHEAIVTTTPEKTWKDFFNQRIRWASKAVHYKDKKIFYVLLLTYLVNFCFLLCAVISFFNPYAFGFLLMLLLAKVIIEFPFVNSAAIFFGRRSLMKYFILLQPLHILYIIIAGWLGRFGSYTWKSRQIKNTGKSLHAIKAH